MIKKFLMSLGAQVHFSRTHQFFLSSSNTKKQTCIWKDVYVTCIHFLQKTREVCIIKISKKDTKN